MNDEDFARMSASTAAEHTAVASKERSRRLTIAAEEEHARLLRTATRDGVYCYMTLREYPEEYKHALRKRGFSLECSVHGYLRVSWAMSAGGVR